MATRASKSKSRNKLGLRPDGGPAPRRRKPGNDNARVITSGLSFRAQNARARRIEDLDWQLRFTAMKLRTWPNDDNPNWAALEALRSRASECRAAFVTD